MNYINIGVSLLLFAIGAFIKYKKVTWLISGCNTLPAEKKEEYDIDELSHHMGNFVFLLAFTWAVMTIIGIIFPNQLAMIMIVGCVIFTFIITGGVIFLNTGNRVKKDESEKH